MSADRHDFHDAAADAAIAEAAARWLARDDRGLTPAEQDAFLQWQAADPRHAAEFARILQAWRTCDLGRGEPELLAMAAELDRTAHAPTYPTARRFSQSRIWAAAAVFALVAGVTWMRWPGSAQDQPPGYEVVASAATRHEFADGSVAMARAGSELRAEFTATERRVVLLHGEAHFTVRKDAARPFVVTAGNAAVRAVGTAFNVRFDPERVEVLVTAGTVQVADTREAPVAPPPLVTAGQRVTIEQEPVADRAPVAVVVAASTEIEEVLGWRSARLVFSRTPLAEAVDAFNRHSPAGSRARLVIGDDALHERRLGGSFRASNIEGFVRLLEQSADVRVERRANEIVLWPAH